MSAWRIEVDMGDCTYSQIEHAGFLRGAEVLALCYFGVRVQLSIR
jgi:hypothetical protein